MIEALKLIPRKISIEGSFKSIRLDQNSSDGSSLQMTFDVPSGMTRDELKQAVLVEKRDVDFFVLRAEYLKGSIDQTVFKARRDLLKERYEKLFERYAEKGQEQNDQPNS